PLHDALGVRIEVVAGLQVRGDQQDDLGAGVVGAGPVDAAPELVAGARARGADVGVRVVAVHSPGGQDALGEAVLARPADVVHDLALAALDDRLADARREVVEHFVPGYLLPLPLTAAPDTAQWKEDAVG